MRITSTAPRRFHDRQDAGRQLARELHALAGIPDLLVLGLPRGGVPVAAEIARVLQCQLDVVLVRKVGVPGFAELAMGAVAAIGGNRSTVRNEGVLAGLAGDGNTIFEAAASRERIELARRDLLYRSERLPPTVKDRSVVLVDDGVATGATLRAAVETVRQLQPKQLMVAVPVFLGQSLADTQTVADRTFWLWDAPSLGSVGQAYRHFEPVPDEEVIRLLQGGPRE
ncbi:putative phosphoribosyltransferase [Arthrobacter sp. CAN_A212]|uniref:phosphoribosyltransferase n=1 Tax=unclassified Arthrobacter TaxID=235627 RepID=UPI0018C90D77|nr:phosphoribosyltransferase family protein [Arthrobacter sp. CAN_C5]MBP2214993.1 putative phosphoribosyltransferase [Arthrobacter sp. CAN_C5]